MLHRALAAILALALAAGSGAQSPAPGNRMFQMIGSTGTTMVDNAGNVVHSWPGALGALSIHLDDDGFLLRGLQAASGPGGGGTGVVQRVALDGSVKWWYVHSSTDFLTHHAVHPMPNGNVLLIVWERKTAAEAIAQGRDPALLNGPDFWPDAIVEVQPTGPASGTIVWEWHVWDHLVQDFDANLPNFGVVADHPELVDINFPPVVANNGDWNHVNGIDYDPIHDWIVLSARAQSEIWIIDHSTTTAEAAGHTGGRWGRGGDLLYRWGNPQAYGRGTSANQQLFLQHDPRFVPPGYPGAGNITVFNNQFTATQSAVFEIDLPLDPSGNFVLAAGQSFGPAAPLWSFTASTFFSGFISGAQRLPNGNTLICSGAQNHVFEVTPQGQTVWSHTSPTRVFHALYVDRTLWTSDTTMSAFTGGNVDLDLIVPSGHGNDIYFVLGSASGTSPGFILGGVSVPLNQDYLLFAMAGAPNSGFFRNNLGTLGPLGRATASLVVPSLSLPPGAVGLRMDFGSVVFDPSILPLLSTNTVPLAIVP